jgi:nicotinate phosphoribosyltransferase
VDGTNAAMLTDLYELTMADSYHRRGMNGRATFDLFVRKLPSQRSFLVACGIADALAYLETMSFDDAAIDFLDGLGMFSDGFLGYLRDLSFTGDVMAVGEGDVVFAEEPLLRVTAPLIEAQIVETFLLNCVGFQTMVASKAARVAIACGDRTFVDFSPRRDHGADAALKAARASYVGGASATSNVLAGSEYGIALSGTMAHSYVMAFPSEIEAFRAFAHDFPHNAVLLIDTFDVEQGARHAGEVALELRGNGGHLAGVRIDSGDLVTLSGRVRAILDDAGAKEARIVASGDLDEYRIAELLKSDPPIDAFGVGTQLGTSGDQPSLGCVYKLVADDHGPKIKLSAGKATLPGCKQVYRFMRDGRYEHDLIALEDEDVRGARPLLHAAMSAGERTAEPAPLDAIRARCLDALAELPDELLSLEGNAPYPVRHSETLDRLVAEMHRRSQ